MPRSQWPDDRGRRPSDAGYARPCHRRQLNPWRRHHRQRRLSPLRLEQRDPGFHRRRHLIVSNVPSRAVWCYASMATFAWGPRATGIDLWQVGCTNRLSQAEVTLNTVSGNSNGGSACARPVSASALRRTACSATGPGQAPPARRTRASATWFRVNAGGAALRLPGGAAAATAMLRPALSSPSPSSNPVTPRSGSARARRRVETHQQRPSLVRSRVPARGVRGP